MCGNVLTVWIVGFGIGWTQHPCTNQLVDILLQRFRMILDSNHINYFSRRTGSFIAELQHFLLFGCQMRIVTIVIKVWHLFGKVWHFCISIYNRAKLFSLVKFRCLEAIFGESRENLLSKALPFCNLSYCIILRKSANLIIFVCLCCWRSSKSLSPDTIYAASIASARVSR